METTGFNKRIHRICAKSTIKSGGRSGMWSRGRVGSRNQNDGIRSVKGANMGVYTVQTLDGIVSKIRYLPTVENGRVLQFRQIKLA